MSADAFVLYNRSTRKTGRLVADALGLPSGIGWRPADTLVRWGNSLSVDAPRTINSSSAIRAASDKLSSLRLMKASGVRVPDFDVLATDLASRVGYPILGRLTHHSKGRDIVVIRSDLEIANRDFYTQLIPCTREYRVHVAFGKIIHTQGKYSADPNSHVVRNHANGFVFKTPRVPLPDAWLAGAVQAVQCHGLDFGAVDMVIHTFTGEPYVLEVNTAPGCAPKTLEAYRLAIADHLAMS